MFKLLKFVLTAIIWLIIFLFIGYCVICVLFPIKYGDEIIKFSKKYDLEPGFVCAIINTESRFKTDAQSHKGAIGLMQLMPGTINWAVEKMEYEDFNYEDIQNPEVNIEIGCWLLSYLKGQLDSDEELMAAAYNAGIGNVRKWLGNKEYSKDGESLDNIPFKETADYVEKVMLYEKVYKIILRTDLYEIANN